MGTLRTSWIGLFVIASGLLLATASVTRAVIVEAGATTVFKDDFENDTINSEPDHPLPGSWAATNVFTHVTDAVSPGPNQGSNYLGITRTGTGETAIADFGAVSSGTVTATFAIYIPTGGDELTNLLQISLTPTLDPGLADIFGAPVWLTNEATDVFTYVAPGGDGAYTDTGVPYQKGVWQTWQIAYTFNTGSNNDDTFTISVDGNTSAPINAGGYGNVIDPSDLQYLDFRTGVAGTFYVDTPVPEPAALGMLALGGLLIIRRRR